MLSTAELAGRQIVVTGGAGALGAAVVDAIVARGGRCHLPVRSTPARPVAGVRYVEGIDLTDEAAVTAFYAGCPPLWASIQVAGGFAGA